MYFLRGRELTGDTFKSVHDADNLTPNCVINLPNSQMNI